MIKNDRQLGAPFGLFSDTKANIEALTGLTGGETAYATDTGEDGVYDAVGSAWVWGRSGGGGFDLPDAIHDATPKTSMANDDEFGMWDSISNGLRKITWSNVLLSIKTYADGLYIALTGNQSIDGTKTFTSFPVTPSSAPTSDYQVANKKYVDDSVNVAVSFGTYTPNIVASNNLTSSSVNGDFMYSRNGNIVTVAGSLNLDYDGSGTAQIDIDLPITSNFTAGTDAAGNGTQPSNENGNGSVIAVASTSTVRLNIGSSMPTGTLAWRIVFMYQLK